MGFPRLLYSIILYKISKHRELKGFPITVSGMYYGKIYGKYNIDEG